MPGLSGKIENIMRTLEIRRHAKRHKPAEHIAQEGVTQARQVGEKMGPFALVISSTLARAFDTAIAMGFAVDREEEWLSDYTDAAEKELPHPASFIRYAEAFTRGKAVMAFSLEQAAHWRDVARELPEGATALLTSHGGVIEMGAAGCLLGDGAAIDFTEWGDALHYCEGVYLHFDGEKFVGGNVLRVSKT